MDVIQFINYVLEKSWKSTFVYFTMWGILLQFLYYIGVLKRYQESILFLLIIISVIGLIITYIHPRDVPLVSLNYVVKNETFQLVDLALHQILLIIFLIMYDPKIKPDNLIFGVVLLLLYCLLYNPFKIYGLNCKCISKNHKHKCDCIQKYNLAISLVIILFIILVLAIKNNIFN